MTEVTLGGDDPRTLLSHAALYGLAAILEAMGASGVRACWTQDGARPRPMLSLPSLNESEVGALLIAHAQSLAADDSWVQRQVNLGGSARALMSPRLSAIAIDAWPAFQRQRQEVLDRLAHEQRWLDLRFLAALGEPCYWRTSQAGTRLQDDAASRLEMQPRNQGSEFVGNRLRKLAAVVAGREPAQVIAGLRGDRVADEIGNDKPDSRTPTGLASPGPTDNALAWCALWGISQFPTTLQVDRSADTAGHLRFRREEWFYAPLWHEPWRPARVRSVLASRFLRVLASFGIREVVAGKERRPYPDTEVAEARAWLGARGVAGVIRFPVARFGSANAPERRAMVGEAISAKSSAGGGT